MKKGKAVNAEIYRFLPNSLQKIWFVFIVLTYYLGGCYVWQLYREDGYENARNAL